MVTRGVMVACKSDLYSAVLHAGLAEGSVLRELAGKKGLRISEAIQAVLTRSRDKEFVKLKQMVVVDPEGRVSAAEMLARWRHGDLRSTEEAEWCWTRGKLGGRRDI
jgi:hypothetical protein